MKDGESQENGGWSKEHVVRGRRAVETLLDLKAIRCLAPFLHGPRTLSEAAAELELSTSTVAYWIRKLEAGGLITRLAPRERAGMPMPRYRAAGQILFLPFSEVPPGMTSELLDGGRKRILDRFLDGLDEVLRKAGHSGLQFSAASATGVEIDLREPTDHDALPPWTDFWGTMHLSRDQAAAFSTDLKDLLGKYRDESGGKTEYVVHAGVAPMPKIRTRSA